MKGDVLERLLIDRAAGQLSPDVAELLEDHIQREPAARREAAEIDETLRLARLALVNTKVIPLPPRNRSLRVPMRAWAMAACFVCGLSLGIFAPRGGKVFPVAASGPPPRMTAALKPDDSAFWSIRRIRTSAAGEKKSEKIVVWKSPVLKPDIL